MRKSIKEKPPVANEETKSTPWYKKKVEKEDFSIFKGDEGKFYLQHKEWPPQTYAGAYDTKKDCEDIIQDYVNISSGKKAKEYKKIHSVILTSKDNIKKL